MRIAVIYVTLLSLRLFLKAESAGLTRRKCCKRTPKIFNVGFDLAGQSVEVDVGRCSIDCGGPPIARSTFLSGLDRIGIEKQQDVLTCKTDSTEEGTTCVPSLSHVETIALNQGPKLYDIIDNCVCQNSPTKCERIAKLKRFFVGTRYETTVDVGDCKGKCRNTKNGKLCRSTQTVSQPVMGPNGMISIEAIAECRCEVSCYRQQFNVALTVMKEDSKGKKRRATKVVDVGRCAGSCRPIEHCVARSMKHGKEKCLMSLETTDVTCAPLRIHDVTYVDQRGNEKRIAQIRRCGCM